MKKKYAPLIWLVVIIVIAIALFILFKNNFFIQKDSTLLKNGMTLTNLYFSDKVIAIHSISCSHCRIVIPILKEIEQENNLTFYYYDLSQEKDLNKIKELGLAPEGIPTVIIYGKVYVGERNKKDYEETILKK